MQPLYRDGDILIISPNAGVRKGDRVVLRTIDGEVMAKVLMRRTAKTIELASMNPTHPISSSPSTASTGSRASCGRASRAGWQSGYGVARITRAPVWGGGSLSEQA
jgi:phage repressor protein C with HTH and peptisase S24 domain